MINTRKDNNQAKMWNNLYENHIDELPWTKNPQPDDLLKQFVDVIKNKNMLLDYGVGSGPFLRYLSKYFSNIHCADISKKALDICKENNIVGANLVKFSEVSFPDGDDFKENFFDGIILWGVLHHIDDNQWKLFLKAFHTILVDGGVMLVGGHSARDKDVVNAPSLYSKIFRFPLDENFIKTIKQEGFNIIDKGTFLFKEALTNKKRDFDYYLLEK